MRSREGIGSLGRWSLLVLGFEMLLRTRSLWCLVFTQLPGAEHMDFIISIKNPPPGVCPYTPPHLEV